MEIDVSKCEHHRFKKRNFDNELIIWCQCKNGACQDYYDDCYYKQLQQLKGENELLKNERTIDLKNQLELVRAENEELKKATITLAEGLNIRQNTLDEIEEIVEQYSNNGIELSVEKQEQILQLIKQAKEGK